MNPLKNRPAVCSVSREVHQGWQEEEMSRCLVRHFMGTMANTGSFPFPKTSRGRGVSALGDVAE